MAFDPNVIPTIALQRLRDDTFYRSVSLAVLITYKTARFLSGEHSGLSGGRYNSPGQQPTLYLSGSQTLASLESEQGALSSGVHLDFPTPRIIGAVKVIGAQVLDLTNPVVLNPLGLTPQILAQPATIRTSLNAAGAPTIAQVVGDAIRMRPDCDGLLVDSWLTSNLAPGFPRPINLVLFMDRSNPDRPRRSSVRLAPNDVGNPGIIAQLDDLP
jgi:RES domain-containing protein